MKAIEENCEEEVWIHWQKLISLGVIRQKEPVFTIVDRVLKVEEDGDYGMGKTMKCLRHTLENLTDREDSRWHMQRSIDRQRNCLKMLTVPLQ